MFQFIQENEKKIRNENKLKKKLVGQKQRRRNVEIKINIFSPLFVLFLSIP